MKLTFLGTCAGTEPMPGRKHAAFALERRGVVYWFDAGELAKARALCGDNVLFADDGLTLPV